MENMVILYDIENSNGDQFILRAYIDNDNCLLLEGQDFSSLAEEMFGDEEYEYYYSFDLENTIELSYHINPNVHIETGSQLLNELKCFFNGEMKEKEFFDICKKYNISYKKTVI